MPNLILNIPEENVNLVLEAFNAMATKESIGIDFEGETRKGFKINPKGENENDLSFAKRVSKEILVSFVKLYKFDLDHKRYRNQINELALPAENIKDNIIE